VVSEPSRIQLAADPASASDSYIVLLRRGSAHADGTAEECQAWRKQIRAAARQDRVKIQTGRCIYLTREGKHRAWAITPERPHGSATEVEVEAQTRECHERLNRMFSGKEPAPESFPWVPADWGD
jgi:hypothetical protein